MTDNVRSQILTAGVVCVGRSGLSRTSLDDVAREAQISRATVYRYFPGGRDELIAATVKREVVSFFQRLAAEVADAPSLSELLETGLMYAHRELASHEVFQKVLETEPERLLPHLTMSGPMILEALTAYLKPMLATETLRDGTSVEETADYLGRMVLSLILGQGSWDVTDAAETRDLVRNYLLKGVLAPSDS